MNIIVVGGGKVGYYLAKILIEKHQITLIEQDEELCKEISNELGIPVINGDGSNLSILEDAGANKADVLLAVTGRDQDNLVACQIADNNFIDIRTIARVNNPKNEEVIQSLGVDVAISSTSIISQLIEKEVAAEELVTLLTFKRGNMTIVEVEIPSESIVANQAVKDVADKLPQSSVLVSLIRQGEIIFPKGNTILKPKDSIIAVTTIDKQVDLERTLLDKK